MRPLFFVLILSSTTFGCGSKDANETEPAAASDHTPTGKHAADDKATEDLQAQKAEEAKAVDTKAAADAETVKAHVAVQAQLQASFDASDRRLNELKQKISKLSAANKKKTDAAVAEADTNEATVMASIAELRDATLPQWNAAKAKVDNDSEVLNKSIDALKKTM